MNEQKRGEREIVKFHLTTSRPEQKALPSPDNITALTEPSSLSSDAARAIDSNISKFRALSLRGRLRITRTMPEFRGPVSRSMLTSGCSSCPSFSLSSLLSSSISPRLWLDRSLVEKDIDKDRRPRIGRTERGGGRRARTLSSLLASGSCLESGGPTPQVETANIDLDISTRVIFATARSRGAAGGGILPSVRGRRRWRRRRRGVEGGVKWAKGGVKWGKIPPPQRPKIQAKIQIFPLRRN